MNNYLGKFYMEFKGKDISYNRWRISYYYTSNNAMTLFFRSKKNYMEFIEDNKEYCLHSFKEFQELFKEEK